MPSTIGTGKRNLRHLNLCFSNFMRPLTLESPPRSPTATSSSLQHDIDHNRPLPTTTATSSITIKNFNSLYDHTLTFEQYSLSSSSFSAASFAPEPEPADLATAFASQRFFFSSPGRSNSIVDSTNTDTNCTPPSSSSSSSSLMATAPPPADADDNKKKLFLSGSVAVPTYSSDPYLDFRRSMQEMVEARPELMEVKSNWDVLHELLLCYLALNPRSTHKFILGAFADLLVSLMSFSSPPDPNPDDNGSGC